jgi:hypothetical protein
MKQVISKKAKQPAVCPLLMSYRLMPHYPDYFFDHFFYIERLTDVVICLAFGGDQFDIVGGRQDNDRDLVEQRCIFDLQAQAMSRLAVNKFVDQDYIGRKLQDVLHCFRLRYGQGSKAFFR